MVRPAGRSERHEAQRALLAVICLAAAAAFCLFVPVASVRTPAKIETIPAVNVANSADGSQAPVEGEIYTGSILFTPLEGNDCRQNLIDNRTGRLWARGVVACDDALRKSTGQRGSISNARVDAIREGFRR